MDKPLRLLSIGAHPADVFDQSGGTMAHHSMRGDYVACIVVTHGARVHDAVISEEMSHRDTIPDADELVKLMAERSDVKTEEVRAAGRILGFEDIYFLGEDDAVLLLTDTVVRKVARLIRRIRPDILLTHFPKEGDGINECPRRGRARSPYTRRASPAAWTRATRIRPHRTTSNLLLRHRRGKRPQLRVGLRGRLLQRRLHRHHRRRRQEAGGAGRPGEPGVRRSLRQEADRDRRRRLRQRGRSRLCRGIHLTEGPDLRLPAALRAHDQAGRHCSDHENIPISSYRIPVD